jgi:YHS domain-containing protein
VQPECLAKIDAADGTPDKVGHKCPNCGLAMEGRAEFSTTVEGFELHSCSEACKEALAANTAGVTARACAH